MSSETAYSSQTRLIGYDLHGREQGLGYSNLTPDPKGPRGPGGQNSSFTKSKNFADKSCQACKNCINPSGGARKTREAGFLVSIILSQFSENWSKLPVI